MWQIYTFNIFNLIFLHSLRNLIWTRLVFIPACLPKAILVVWLGIVFGIFLHLNFPPLILEPDLNLPLIQPYLLTQRNSGSATGFWVKTEGTQQNGFMGCRDGASKTNIWRIGSVFCWPICLNIWWRCRLWTDRRRRRGCFKRCRIHVRTLCGKLFVLLWPVSDGNVSVAFGYIHFCVRSKEL